MEAYLKLSTAVATKYKIRFLPYSIPLMNDIYKYTEMKPNTEMKPVSNVLIENNNTRNA